MIILLMILEFCFPILFLPISILGIIMSKCHKKIYCIMFALSLATIAYTWTPRSNYDLSNWYIEMKNFQGYNFSQMINVFSRKFEIFNYLSKYFISKTGNFRLLQFTFSFFGYYMISIMITDLAKKYNSSIFIMLILLMLSVLSLTFIDFISGIWFFFATILFAFGYYCEFEKNTKRIHYFFYVSSFLFHITLILPFIILQYSKAANNKARLINIVIFIIIIIMFEYVLSFLAYLFHFSLFIEFKNLYNLYFLDNTQFKNLHSISNKIIAILKILPSLFAIIALRKNKNVNNLFQLLIIITTLVFVLILNGGVFIRFSYLIVLLGLPNLYQIFNSEISNKKKLALIFLILIICIILFYKQILLINESGILSDIKNNIYKNLIKVLGGV